MFLESVGQSASHVRRSVTVDLTVTDSSSSHSVDAAAMGRRRGWTDGMPAASAPSQNCNYDKVAVIGRLAQGSPAISSSTEKVC